jgi:hypothetical protein
MNFAQYFNELKNTDIKEMPLVSVYLGYMDWHEKMLGDELTKAVGETEVITYPVISHPNEHRLFLGDSHRLKGYADTCNTFADFVCWLDAVGVPQLAQQVPAQ